MLNHNRIGDITGIGTEEIEFLTNFSLPEFDDGNTINQHTGMPFSFSECLANEEVNDLPLLTTEELMEITRVEELALNKSTTKQTKNHVNELRTFLESKKLPNIIEKIPPKYLCQYLRLWFSTMKKRDGESYSLSTLACKRASIQIPSGKC